MSRSNISKMKLEAIRLISKKVKLERRITSLQEELVNTTATLDKFVKTIGELKDKVHAPSK